MSFFISEEGLKAWRLQIEDYALKIYFKVVLEELKEHLIQRELVVLENKLPSDTVNLISEFLK